MSGPYLLPKPKHFKDANGIVEGEEAIRLEYEELLRKGTWKMVQCPPNTTPIGCKWVYTTKVNSDGSLNKYKDMLGAKGYNQ